LIPEGIPSDYPVRVVREDPEVEGLLYAGTEFGLFVSMDDGATWQSFQQNLPVTPITDIKLHRGDLAMSTMGRGFWVLDNLTTLRQMANQSLSNQPFLFAPQDTYRYRYPSARSDFYPRPLLMIDYYLPDAPKQALKLEIVDEAGETVHTFFSDQPGSGDRKEEDMSSNLDIYIVDRDLKAEKGMNRFEWDMRHPGPWTENKNRRYRYGPMVVPGSYTVKVTYDDQELSQTFRLMADPRVLEEGTSQSDMKAQETLALELVVLISETSQWIQSLEKEQKSLQQQEDQSERLGQIEAVLDLLVTKDGTYMKPMLEDQMGYLYYIVNGPDQMPGADAYQRFEELQAELAQLKAEYAQ
jgi:hypothetical protein